MRERICRAAEGNPLFVEQMVALVHGSGDGDIVVPPTIQALLAARLDQLDPSERGVLQAGAVEGRLFHRGAVQALTPEEPEVATRLTGLVRKELVRPDKPLIPGDDAFRFRHLLIRDAAYEALPKAARAELHARFADWLEHRGRELVELDEILGFHLERAARYKAELGVADEQLAARARERLAAAGRRALSRVDGAATGLLERAIALLPPDAYDVDLELDLADALFSGGRPGEVERLTESLAERAAANGDRCGELRARLIQASVRVYVDQDASLEDLEGLAEEARPVLEAAADALGLYSVWLVLATVEHSRLRNEAKLVASEKAVEYARLAGDERRANVFIPFLTNARYFGPTPASEALRWIEEQQASGLQHPALTAHRAELLAMLGRPDEARAAHAAHHARMLELGAAVPEAISYDIAAEIEWLIGDIAAAERSRREACVRLEQMGHHSWLSTMAGTLGWLLCALGRYDEADEWAEKSRSLGARDDIATQVVWRIVRATVLAHRGDVQQAEELARAAVALVETTDNIQSQGDVLRGLAEVLALAGRRDEAAAELRRAVALYEQKENVVMAGRAAALLAELGAR